MNEKCTKAERQSLQDTMRAEYDVSGAVGGKHHARYLERTKVVVLDPDVVAAFRNADEVNDALRALLRVAREKGN